MGTSTGAEHAEHTAAEVVLVLHKALFLLTVFCFVKFAGHLNRTIGACHLAESATDALVFVGFVVGHDEGTTEAVEHLQLLTVFGILLGDFLREELTHRNLQPRAE